MSCSWLACWTCDAPALEVKHTKLYSVLVKRQSAETTEMMAVSVWRSFYFCTSPYLSPALGLKYICFWWYIFIFFISDPCCKHLKLLAITHMLHVFVCVCVSVLKLICCTNGPFFQSRLTIPFIIKQYISEYKNLTRMDFCFYQESWRM